MIRRPPRSTRKESSAASDVYKRQKYNNVPIRVGVNAGSLEKDLQKKYGEPNADALVESALRHVDILDKFNFDNYKMSLKASNIEMTVEAYRKISKLIDQPLHLGITEAGSYRAGTVKSVSYTHLRAHETLMNLVCRLLLEKSGDCIWH